MSLYKYNASVISVVDGDTLWLEIDLGFDTYQNMTFRLAGVATPKMSTPEGEAARSWLVARLAPHDNIVIETFKDRKEKYGRYLATIWLGDVNVNEEMLVLGVAEPYPAPSRTDVEDPDAVEEADKEAAEKKERDAKERKAAIKK